MNSSDLNINANDLYYILNQGYDYTILYCNMRVLAHRERRLQKRVEPIWHAILRAFLEAGIPQTVRQVFYKCTTYGVVPKTENGYSKVGEHLLTMRRVGVVPYGWIADNTRWMRKPDTYDSLTHMLMEAQKTYRRALWNDQDYYIEIWLEKDALSGVISDITSEFDVPLMVTRGYSSETFAYNAAQAINYQRRERDKLPYIYYFGDHDPSGVDARNDIERKLTSWCDLVFFRPVAVLPWQIDAWVLPSRPTKRTDKRAKNWKGDSVELDAIPADKLRALCRKVIENHIEPAALEMSRKVEKEERETLATVLETLNGASPE